MYSSPGAKHDIANIVYAIPLALLIAVGLSSRSGQRGSKHPKEAEWDIHNGLLRCLSVNCLLHVELVSVDWARRTYPAAPPSVIQLLELLCIPSRCGKSAVAMVSTLGDAERRFW